MQKKKMLTRKLQNALDTILETEMNQQVVTEELNSLWRFIVNEKEGLVIAFAPDGSKYIQKTEKGDKFNLFTGCALAVFRYYTGLTYKDVCSIIDLIVPPTKRVDYALKFIETYVLENTSLTKEVVEEAYKFFQKKNGDKPVVTFNMTVLADTFFNYDEEDDADEEDMCSPCVQNEEPQKNVLDPYISILDDIFSNLKF